MKHVLPRLRRPVALRAGGLSLNEKGTNIFFMARSVYIVFTHESKVTND